MPSLPIQELSKLDELITARNGENRAIQDEEHALQLFLRVWDKAPSRWKAKCQVPTTQANSVPRDRVRVDLWSRDTVTVLTQLRLWNNDPLSFFMTKVIVPVELSENPFTRLYCVIDQLLGDAAIIQKIRLRIAQIGLHTLMKRLERCQLRSHTEIENEFACRVQVKGDSAIIGKRSKDWARKGGKYESLTKQLGGLGAIICLPNDISSAKLERIPPDGEIRRDAIECFRRRGINDKTKTNIKLCYDVAEKIWKVIQADVDSYFLQHELSSQMLTSQKRKGESPIESPSNKRRQQNQPSSVPLMNNESRQHEEDTAAGQSNEGMPSITPSCRADASNLDTENSDGNIRGPLLPIVPIETPHLEPQNANYTPLQDRPRDFWNDMTSIQPYSSFWNDMCDIPPVSDFWVDMHETLDNGHQIDFNALTC